MSIGPHFLGDGKTNPLIMEVAGNTVGECLNPFISQEPGFSAKAFDEAGELKATAHILVNQAPVLTNQLQRAVRDGDEIGVIYASPTGC